MDMLTKKTKQMQKGPCLKYRKIYLCAWNGPSIEPTHQKKMEEVDLVWWFELLYGLIVNTEIFWSFLFLA